MVRRSVEMIAAIYVRRSTEQNGVADEAKSVTRQIEHKKTLARELAGLDGVAKVASLDASRLTKLVRAGAADVQALLGQSIPQSRQMLRKVLVVRLPCEGFVEAGRRGYRFAGTGTRLLAGEAATSDGDPG